MPSFTTAFTSRDNPRPKGLPLAWPGPLRSRGVSFADRCLPAHNPGPANVPLVLPGTGPFGLRNVQLASRRAMVPADALKRRELSLRHLQLDGIPVYPDLPCLPGRDQVVMRAPAVVLTRLQALLLLTGLAQHQYNRAEFDRLVEALGVQDAFDPHERAFLDHPIPSEDQALPFCWGQEAVWALLWALHEVPSIGKPTALCDARRTADIVLGPTALSLISRVRLRPIDEILGEADRTYRYHWAVHDAQLQQQPVPGGLIADVVEQRRMALEWLIGRGGPSDHPGAGWIEVDLST